MKNNSHSACLLFFVFLLLISGFAGLVSAEDKAKDYDFSKFNKSSYKGEWDELSSPTSEYKIWGYTGQLYNFTTSLKKNCTIPLGNTTMVFYWNCHGDENNTSDFTPLPINNTNNKQTSWNCTHRWNKQGTYYVSVGMFRNNEAIKVSYWVPIRILNDTTIEVRTFSMVDENNSNLDQYILNSFNSSGNSTKREYCTYADKTQYFSTTINATINNSSENQTEADRRAIKETTTEVNWDDNFYDYNSFNQSIELDNSSNIYSWNENFTHKWEKTGEKNISVRNYHWDPLSGNQVYSNNSSNATILIIRDPKNFLYIKDPKNFLSFYNIISFITEPFSNLQNLGIFLVSAGLMILFFTYTKNNVPVKIALFGLKPFYLKSVDTFIGIFTFVAGMYLYIIFGRCPWDIPIISKLPLLPDAYFSVLYYEYAIQKWSIPYLSILLGLVVVFTSSMILYRIGSPFLKGDLNSGNIFRGKKVLLPRLNTLRISLLLKRK